ncbi:MAG: hypothetical protein MZV70_36140 [Desulfobacterales bacterium]|nr:hypothetical protein [Desulfobacterales bacterium]
MKTGSFISWGQQVLMPRSSEFYARSMVFLERSSNLYGSADSQLSVPREIDTDGTYIYVCENTTSVGKNRIAQFLLSDYSYIATWGTYGNGTGQFSGPVGLTCVSVYSTIDYTPASYPILVADNNGAWVDFILSTDSAIRFN